MRLVIPQHVISQYMGVEGVVQAAAGPEEDADALLFGRRTSDTPPIPNWEV